MSFTRSLVAARAMTQPRCSTSYLGGNTIRRSRAWSAADIPDQEFALSLQGPRAKRGGTKQSRECAQLPGDCYASRAMTGLAASDARGLVLGQRTERCIPVIAAHLVSRTRH